MQNRSTWRQRIVRLFGDQDAPRAKSPRSRSLRLALEPLEDRKLLTAGVAAAYTLTQDWGSGFQAQIALTNQQSVPVTGWQLEFDFARNISSIWDAKIVSHTGNHYVVQGASYDSDLAAGSVLSFGFLGTGSGAGTAPANFVVNGAATGGQTAPVPSLTIADVSANEGNSGTSNLVFNATLSAPSTKPVTVSFSTADGTAQAGSDYRSLAGTLTFAPGVTKQQVSVPVIGDTSPESNETFSVTLSGATGATIARAKATGTILNDDTPPASGSFSFQVTSDWGRGFTGQITMTNGSQQTVSGWQLEFDFAGQITSIWDASILSHAGSHYVIQNGGWNASIAPGGTASFGFNGSPGGSPIGPTNYYLHNAAVTGGGGTTNHAPTPVGDSILVNPGQALVLNLLANDRDPDGDLLSIVSITQPKSGAAVLNKDGTVTYTPKVGFTGSDTFTYTVSDGRGGTASAAVTLTVGTPAATVSWSAQYYAPYVDVTLTPTYNLAATTQSQGIKFYTLAFITADSKNQPAWGGYDEYEINGGAFDMALRQQVAAVRAAGGDVMPSFGGAAGQELAQTITDVSKLTAAYQTVITDYNLTHLDFDIEGAAVADHASIDRRSQAMAALQQTATATGRPLQIWFTLPVLPTGLTGDGLYVLQSALRYGVKIGGVNIMAMDYGDATAPNPQGQMGTYAIAAANSLFAQMHTLYGSAKTDAQLWSMIGVTPMIGVNDQTDEVFDQQAAQQLVAFANQKGMARISMWSLNRDTAGKAKNFVDPISSSIAQNAYDFSHIFLGI